MVLPSKLNPLSSYNKMLETAEFVASRLNADIKDKELNLLTSQSCTHDRQCIEEYVRKSLRSHAL
jgi:FtsZ-interacting cell division protein ZipA